MRYLLYAAMDKMTFCPLLRGMLVITSPVLVVCGADSGMTSSRPASRNNTVAIGWYLSVSYRTIEGGGPVSDIIEQRTLMTASTHFIESSSATIKQPFSFCEPRVACISSRIRVCISGCRESSCKTRVKVELVVDCPAIINVLCG